jgi:hypothetical protein
MKTILIVGGSGTHAYTFPQGEPAAQPYPLGDAVVAKVDFIEYLAFYGEFRWTLPESIDILDIGYWTDAGVKEEPDVDFRADGLYAMLQEYGDLRAVYDRTEVEPLRIVASTDDGIVLESGLVGNFAQATLWSVYVHVKRGVADAWFFHFRNEKDARTMAALLHYRMNGPRDVTEILARIGVSHA